MPSDTPDLKDLPLTKINVGRRLSISASSDEIRLDGEVIGTRECRRYTDYIMGSPAAKVSWVAKLNLNGETSTVEARSFSALSDRVVVVVTGMLRKQNPDAERGVLVLKLAGEDFAQLLKDGRGVVKMAYTGRVSRVNCPKGRPVVLLNVAGREGHSRSRLEAAIERVEYVQPPGQKRRAHLSVVVTAVPEAPAAKTGTASAEPALPHETQADICTWAGAAFAERPLLTCITRALREYAYLTAACTDRAPSAAVAEEAADVVIYLCEVAERAGVADLVATKPTDTARRASALERLLIAGKNLLILLNEVALLDATPTADAKHPVTQVVKAASEHVAGAVAAICENVGTTLPDAVAAKMAENRRRKWNADGTQVRGRAA